MVEPLRHRQTKGAATVMFYLMPPRHISTLRTFAKSLRSAMRIVFLPVCFDEIAQGCVARRGSRYPARGWYF